VLHTLHISYSFDSNYIWRRVQVMKLLTSRRLLPFWSRYSSEHSVLRYHQSIWSSKQQIPNNVNRITHLYDTNRYIFWDITQCIPVNINTMLPDNCHLTPWELSTQTSSNSVPLLMIGKL
jgi:hypothetical protein